VDVALGAARAVLDDAAAQIDADPKAEAQRLAVRVRSTVEAAASEVIERVGRALGAGPLCRDADRRRPDGPAGRRRTGRGHRRRGVTSRLGHPDGGIEPWPKTSFAC
jgi:hypothetical protein